MHTRLKLKLDHLFFPKLENEAHDFQALSKSLSDWHTAQRSTLDQNDSSNVLPEARKPEASSRYNNEELIA